MKETSKSLKVYFIIIGLLGVIGSLLQVFLGIAFISSIYTVSALILSFFYYILGFLFLYFGIEMYRFLKDSPKTLIGFLIFVLIANSVYTFLSGEIFSILFIIAIGCYLIYNINKASKEKSSLEEKINKQSIKKQILIIVGILIVVLIVAMLMTSNVFIEQRDYSQEIIKELERAIERGELEETLEELSK